jgi:hypothetical protein
MEQTPQPPVRRTTRQEWVEFAQHNQRINHPMFPAEGVRILEVECLYGFWGMGCRIYFENRVILTWDGAHGGGGWQVTHHASPPINRATLARIYFPGRVFLAAQEEVEVGSAWHYDRTRIRFLFEDGSEEVW